MPTITESSDADIAFASSYSATGSSGGNSSGALLSGSQAQMAGGAIGAFGTAIGDFMAIDTDKKAAAAYAQAAALAGENINITETATNIQEAQSKRALAKTLGQQSAAIAANGFAQGTGSGADIYRASVQQGALAQSLITSQGAVTENAYRAQQQADLQLEAQARAKAGADLMGGIFSTAQGILDVAAMA